MSRILISLFTDASFSHKKREGGWAFWAKKKNITAWGGGKFKRQLRSSNEAELCAVANAVVELEKRRILTANCHVLIQTDSDHTVRAFSKSPPTMSPLEIEARQIVVNRAKHNQWSFNLRHVKGHSSNSAKRFIVNNLVDRHAGRYSRS